ncbi:hypothetical protein DFP72DRAFT_890887 [Ephemerocybe angulata]|uniref:Probable 26S proteasome regulatory subunit p27 n=1 Tax=Ephemerocybe angulata TaxID=980116 RepID=A0A8H6I3N3_9AGAR|nr:hypothetical protein DFP72DRAFT_890887 [Tulosesus angulatus]
MGRELPNPESPREQARKLMDQKSNIEAELEAHFTILKANNVTMDTPLVDREGFPRADVDIYAVRGARKRVIELRNDLKWNMEEMAKVLQVIYALPADGEESGAVEVEVVEKPTPFAKVEGVAPGSPARDAGMLQDDQIIKFGGLSHKSFEAGSLQPLVSLVGANENRPISITVLRSGESKVLSLTPRKGWGGRGLLGCHIVPYTPDS